MVAKPAWIETQRSRAMRTSREWIERFQKNADALLDIPWEKGAECSALERDTIARSLQVMQHGEGMEGAYFFRCARQYAHASGDVDYVEAHRLFMEEEKRHARDLGRFMGMAQIPPIEGSWMSGAFCWLGRRGNLESCIMVVVTAEILAQVYYAALRNASSSTTLRRICSQILRDELFHVRFQFEQLAKIRCRRHRWKRTLCALAGCSLDRYWQRGTLTDASCVPVALDSAGSTARSGIDSPSPTRREA